MSAAWFLAWLGQVVSLPVYLAVCLGGTVAVIVLEWRHHRDSHDFLEERMPDRVTLVLSRYDDDGSWGCVAGGKTIRSTLRELPDALEAWLEADRDHR